MKGFLKALAGTATVFVVGVVQAQATQPAAAAPSSVVPEMTKQYVFPVNKQSEEQQAKDEKDCGAWAAKESGYDPAKPPAPPQAPAPPQQPQQAQQGSAGKAAVKGAAAGYIIGDLANDEGGEGAAIGAVVGAASARRKKGAAQQSAQQQQQAASQQYQQELSKYQADVKAKQGEFLKARAACLEAKGYTVK